MTTGNRNHLYGLFVGFIIMVAVILSLFPGYMLPKQKTFADFLLQRNQEYFDACLWEDLTAAKTYESSYTWADA